MKNLFTKKDPSDLRSVRFPILLTKKEAEQIRQRASARNMNMSEYIRHTSLRRGAKDDFSYEKGIISTLRLLSGSVTEMTRKMKESGVATPEEEWSLVLDEAIAVIRQITK